MSLSPMESQWLRRYIHEKVGLVIGEEKDYLFDTRLAPTVRRHSMASVSELIVRMQRGDTDLEDEVFESLLTNESSFFRDRAPFEALRDRVIPDLMARRGDHRALSVWSAGCAHGQEAYSIAILLAEHFPELASWSVSVLATDVSGKALERARAGRFTQMEASRGLPAHTLVRYFDREGKDWVVKEDLRRRVVFHRHNLLTDSWREIPRMDVVFLRNVLIYFDAADRSRLLGRVRDVMYPDGYLFLGSAESAAPVHGEFVRMRGDKSGCHRLRDGEQVGSVL